MSEIISKLDESLTPEGVTELRALSHEELCARTVKLAEVERRVGVAILRHLAEINRRRAFAKLGYGSLWDYVIGELKYSESAAYLRISAMHALRENPELEEKIQSGTLSVSAVSQVHTFFRAEQVHANKRYSSEERAELYGRCEGKSSRQVTRELLDISPHAIRVQNERVVSENRTIISFLADAPLLQKIHRVRDLSVSRLKDPASYPALVGLMSEITLDKIDPLRKRLNNVENPDKNVALITSQPTRKVGRRDAHEGSGVSKGYAVDATESRGSKGAPSIDTPSTSAPPSTPPRPPSRHIPSLLRSQVWREAGARCTYVSPETGRRCSCTYGLEIEHCEPHAVGGSSVDISNLTLLCRRHNQWRAIQSYGLEKMAPYLERKSETNEHQI